jgi:glyoxylase-like metal-dependent hydrolase (beta-lactamase superfamily II)
MTATNPAFKFLEMRDRPPAEAQFFWNGGPVEVAERTWFASLVSGATGFETDEGLVLVDTGTVQFGPVLAQAIREHTGAPVHTAIYTHGHVDHAFGLDAFLVDGQAPPVVIAHEAMAERFDRYARTSRHNVAVNNRQFSGAASDDSMTGGGEIRWEAPSHLPTVTYRDTMSIEVGGVTFELHHCRGETDDHTWVYCPDRGVVCPGDLIIWGVPNAGNPQKVQRYPWDWAEGLRAMAALHPRSLAPGHGGPVVDDPELVQRILLETADYLELIVERTIAVMEDGSPPHVDIVRSVELPISDSPWLQPVYDEGEFIVRNVVRYFGGWWTGRPSELKPAPRTDVARQVAKLAGGTDALVAEARTLADAGDLAVACHLADYALEVDPSDSAVAEQVAEIYDRRAEAETSLMAINIYRSAAAYAREGRAYR